MSKIRINRKLTLLYTVFLVISFSKIYSQKAGGFYDKLYEFDFPSTPIPVDAVFYKTVNQLKTGKITMKDYRGEMATLNNFNLKRPTYHNEYINYSRLVSVLSGFDDLKSNKSNTVYYQSKNTNILLSYQKGENDTIYNVYGKFDAKFDAKFQEKTIYKDSLQFNEKVGEIYSTLKGKDFDIVAKNKCKSIALDANDIIMVKAHNAFQSFVRSSQMFYSKTNVPFFKIKKTKKLISEKETNSLTQQIRSLHTIDNGFESRTDRNKQVELLIETLSKLIESEDYKVHDAYKVFVHGNLGSLYTLLEDYQKGIKQYDLAASFDKKGKLVSYYNGGKRDATRSLERKENLFLLEDNTVKPEFNNNYYEIYTKNKL